MICPVCREQMIVVEFKKIELDICSTCRGAWFDAEELELLLASVGLDAAQLIRPLEKRTEERHRKCPRCRRRMAKVLAGQAGEVMVDTCRDGHGLWFDGGELDAVVAGLQRAAAEAGLADSAGGRVGSFLKDVLLAGENS